MFCISHSFAVRFIAVLTEFDFGRSYGFSQADGVSLGIMSLMDAFETCQDTRTEGGYLFSRMVPWCWLLKTKYLQGTRRSGHCLVWHRCGWIVDW